MWLHTTCHTIASHGGTAHSALCLNRPFSIQARVHLIQCHMKTVSALEDYNVVNQAPPLAPMLGIRLLL